MPDDSLPAISIPIPRGRSRRLEPNEPLVVRVVRELTEDDLAHFSQMGRAGNETQSLQSLRHSHHQVARLLVSGAREEAVSLITGYHPQTISRLQGDPSFRELLHYYATQVEQIWVDAEQRMQTLGISAIEELQSRIDTAPSEWSRRELMDLAEMALAGRRAAIAGARPGGSLGPGGISLNISFAESSAARAPVTINQALGGEEKE